MESSHLTHAVLVLFSCLLLAAVVSCESSQHDSALDDEEIRSLQPQKRSVGDLSPQEEEEEDSLYPSSHAFYPDDKRSSLFRFGKRSSLFRFGKRGSLFRFGKRGSLFRFGKRGSLFRFGKRDGDLGEGWVFYPEDEITSPEDDGFKREVKSFHWGREIDE